MSMRKNKKVWVGLSGGVDSAVSAALLQREGYDVTGAFIKIWRPEFMECTWREDRLDAMRVAAALGIPFREIDLSEEYKKAVVDAMVRDYAAGITPNPDVLCNRSIKFGAFAHWAFEEGADMVATGHYAQAAVRGDTTVLMRGLDPAKDQSYFLHRVDGDVLSRVLFPVGGMLKPHVRTLAQEFDLPVAQKHDSQGLCMIGNLSMREALSHFITVEQGEVIDEEGAVIGSHEGAGLYTIGQRHGFTVAGEEGRAPHYVIQVNTRDNTIIVSRDKNKAARMSIAVRDMHWVGETTPPSAPLHGRGTKYKIQTRYREKPVVARIEITEEGIVAHCDEPHIVAPGQSLVVYDGDVCLGGGPICV